jgi:hypothetical protein
MRYALVPGILCNQTIGNVARKYSPDSTKPIQKLQEPQVSNSHGLIKAV